MNNNNIGKFYRVFLPITALALCAVIALTVIVDPFFHYHAPLKGFPYVVDNQLLQNPGMARNMLYDSVMTGSSMTLNFDTDDFRELMGLDLIKLCSNGAYPKDISNVLSVVFQPDSRARKNNDVKAVFAALDISTFTAEPEETKYPLPEYMYDRTPLNDISYLLNKDVILEYILKPVVEKEPTDLSYVYGTTWQTEEYFNEAWVLRDYRAPEAVSEPLAADALIPRTKVNLEENILPYVEEHPETEFYFFFPPYSILYWNNVRVENRLDAVLAQSEYMMERLLGYPNVRVFYFQNEEEMITDLNNYADMEHYRPAFNRYMTECFADGTDEVFPDTVSGETEKMRKIVDSFDFGSLFE